MSMNARTKYAIFMLVYLISSICLLCILCYGFHQFLTCGNCDSESVKVTAWSKE